MVWMPAACMRAPMTTLSNGVSAMTSVHTPWNRRQDHVREGERQREERPTREHETRRQVVMQMPEQEIEAEDDAQRQDRPVDRLPDTEVQGIDRQADHEKRLVQAPFIADVAIAPQQLGAKRKAARPSASMSAGQRQATHSARARTAAPRVTATTVGSTPKPNAAMAASNQAWARSATRIRAPPWPRSGGVRLTLGQLSVNPVSGPTPSSKGAGFTSLKASYRDGYDACQAYQHRRVLR